MYVDNLIFEVTRRCNATCSHCLRGDVQNKDIDNVTIEAALRGVDAISSLVFTGGEPSLAVDRIKYIIKTIKRLKISVNSFYLVTNGKKKSLPLAQALMELYAYCDENEGSSFCISKDQYHTSDIGSVDDADTLYRGLSFYHPDDRTGEITVLVDEGRANELGMGQKNADIDISYEHTSESTEHIDRIDSTVYVNALGDVIPGCDLSYDSQDEHKIGSVHQNTLEEIFLRQSIAA